MADDVLELDSDRDRKDSRGTQSKRALDAIGLDASTLAAGIGEAIAKANHAPMKADPLREFVRATVCAKDDGGTHIPISFTKDELQDPSYAGRMFNFGAKVRLKRDAFIQRANREHVWRAE